ncbi:MAG: uroporphyrinogen-III synthase [Candidatus Eiseniibacteriota bacterium]
MAAVAAAVRGSATPDGALPGDAATASPATVGAAPHDASGGRVAITRRATLAASLAAALRTRGIEVLALPTIRIDPPADREALARAAAVLEEFDWVVLTSTNAARALVHCRRPPWPASLQVACVGRATAAAVEQHGQRVHLVPGEQHGAGLLAALSPRLEEGRAETPPGTALLHQAVRVLLPLSSIARRTVPDGLRAAGAEVVEVEAYRTVPDEAGARRLLDGVRSGTIDAVVVTSPSSLAALLEAAAADTSRHAGRAPDAPGPTAPAPSGHTAAWPYRVPLVAIGATTAAAMREHGVEPAAEAPSPDVPGMVAALDSLWKQRTHRAGEATG